MSNVYPFPKLTIQPLQAQQLEAAIEFLTTEWVSTYGAALTIEQRKQMCTSLDQQVRANPRNTFVASQLSRVVGIALISSNCLDSIFVAKTHRRQGLASLLLRHCIEALATKGFQFAQAGCENDNLPFARLLENFDFAQIWGEQGVRVYSLDLAATASTR